MLLDDCVEIPINGNRSYWEDLGYEVPTIRDYWGRRSVKRGTKIKVKVGDLPPKSRTKVRRKCDNCGKIDEVHWYAYRDFCLKCSNKLFPKKGYSLEEVQKIFEENGCKLISDKYISNDKKLKYVCECGRESEINLSRFLFGGRCRDCGLEKAWKTKFDRYEYGKNIVKHDISLARRIKRLNRFICIKCQFLGKANDGFMICHHLESWDINEELRRNMDNCVCICKKCHKEFHKIYGSGKNTREQFVDFIEGGK